jgi:type III secretion system chaperone SycN
MNLIEETVWEFGRSVGLDDLSLRGRGAAVLEIENVGTLAFDAAGPGGEAVVVSLSRPLPFGRSPRWGDVLARTHYRRRGRGSVQAGVSGDRLVFAVMLPAGEFSLHRISEVLRDLDDAHRSVEGFR